MKFKSTKPQLQIPQTVQENDVISSKEGTKLKIVFVFLPSRRFYCENTRSFAEHDEEIIHDKNDSSYVCIINIFLDEISSEYTVTEERFVLVFHDEYNFQQHIDGKMKQALDAVTLLPNEISQCQITFAFHGHGEKQWNFISNGHPKIKTYYNVINIAELLQDHQHKLKKELTKKAPHSKVKIAVNINSCHFGGSEYNLSKASKQQDPIATLSKDDLEKDSSAFAEVVRILDPDKAKAPLEHGFVPADPVKPSKIDEHGFERCRYVVDVLDD